MDERLAKIRENERKSHIEMYSNEELYNSESWLKKPIKTVCDLMPLFGNYKKLKVLDLDCGVGRNCLAIAYEYKNYDLIIGVSSLEHIDTKDSFVSKLTEIKDGIRKNGIVCLVINSQVREFEKSTGQELSAQFEVNLSTDELQQILEGTFTGWSVLKSTVQEQQYDIPRGSFVSDLRTNVVTYVAKK